jgi:hypothetical protein
MDSQCHLASHSVFFSIFTSERILRSRKSSKAAEFHHSTSHLTSKKGVMAYWAGSSFSSSSQYDLSRPFVSAIMHEQNAQEVNARKQNKVQFYAWHPTLT